MISETITSKSLRQQILDHPNIPLQNKKQALQLLEIGVAQAYNYVFKQCGIKLKVERLNAQNFDRHDVRHWKKIIKAAWLIQYGLAISFTETVRDEDRVIVFTPKKMNNNNPLLIATKELLFQPGAKKRLMELMAIYHLNTAVNPKDCRIYFNPETGRVNIRA